METTTSLIELEERLTQPSEALLADISKINGDIMLLGAGGKMGPSMAILAKKAFMAAGLNHRVIAVSRFSDEKVKDTLHEAGVLVKSADLLNEEELFALPLVENIIYLAGYKFGSSGNEPFTWAMNSYLPGRVAEKYRNARIVAFSTGNVLPFAATCRGGQSEEMMPAPIGEYGQSCLGRERIFQYFAEKNNTETLIYRLNYATDFRYGVLQEIAKSVLEGHPIDLSTGQVNVIWQGDANEFAIRALLHCTTPARILNITGPETLSVRWLAEQFGILFKKQPLFTQEEQSSALLSNASAAHQLFGYPRTTVRDMIDITAQWLLADGDTFGKATHFQERGGQF